jgi:pyruvate carboxylase
MSFPESVIGFFKGELGEPLGGFPEHVRKIILKDEPTTIASFAKDKLDPIDFESDFKEFKSTFGKDIDLELSITDFLSFKLYPKVFVDYYNHYRKYGNVINIPTKNFFYGMELGEEIMVEIDKGKRILIQLEMLGEPDQNGNVSLFFKINGQINHVIIKDSAIKVEKKENKKADINNPNEVGAPLQGLLSKMLVKKGELVKKNQPLFVIEAMKMETTVTSTKSGLIKEILLDEGIVVNSLDLIIVLSD